MEAYTDFAQVYDEFMDETPYEEWCAFLVGMLGRYGLKEVADEDSRLLDDTYVISDGPNE